MQVSMQPKVIFAPVVTDTAALTATQWEQWEKTQLVLSYKTTVTSYLLIVMVAYFYLWSTSCLLRVH